MTLPSSIPSAMTTPNSPEARTSLDAASTRAIVVRGSRQTLGRHSRTFALAGKLLPREMLDDAAVVYAFCRLADDLVDEAPSYEQARQDAERLRAELDGLAPGRPLTREFIEVCRRLEVPLQPARDLLDGVLSDVRAVRIQNDAQLLHYCYQVAGTVGLMMSGVLRVHDPEARHYAVSLGIGMQLTNICRDVLEDAGRDRVYLPADRLRAVDVRHASIIDGSAPPDAVRSVVYDLLDLAEHYYAEGELGSGAIPGRPRFGILAAARMYRAIGRRIRRGRVDPLTTRSVVPGWAKLWCIGSAAVAAPFKRWPLQQQP